MSIRAWRYVNRDACLSDDMITGDYELRKDKCKY